MFENISELTTSTNLENAVYFLDANVWLYGWQGEECLNDKLKVYANFFYKIFDSNDKIKPKVLIPSLLFSEIFNKYISSLAFDDYKSIKKDSTLDFKKDFKKKYRKSKHYFEWYNNFFDDIKSLRNSIEFISDSQLIYDTPLYMEDLNHMCDFNDLFYYKLCSEYQQSKRIIFVTNDSDFVFNDIEILTANSTLLKLKKK